MEDYAGLLGKTMNSALYWLLHLIDTLLALASKLWWVPRRSRCVFLVLELSRNFFFFF